MKKIVLLIMLITLGCSSSTDDKDVIIDIKYKSVQERLNENETPISIYNSGVVLDSLYGKNYKGGLIYYLNTSNGTGLVAHWQDNSSALNWGGSADIAAANNTIIGSGLSNTNAITNYYLNTNTAADYCDNLVLNNYSDWFLPSKDEMLMMINVLKDRSNVYFGAVTGYWTSSNYDYKNVWMIRSDKTPIIFLKYNSVINYDVRIRSTRVF